MKLSAGLRILAILAAVVGLAASALCLSIPASADEPVVTVHLVTTGVDWARTQPHVAYDSQSDRYLFVWRDKRNDAPDNRHDPPVGRCDYYNLGSTCWPNADIYGRLVDGSGSFLSDELPIASDVQRTRDQQWPFAAFSPDKAEFLVAWQEVSPLAVRLGNSQNWFSTCYDIVARQVGSDGVLASTPITVSDAIDCQWVPVLSYDNQWGDFLVTWHDHRYRSGQNPPRPYPGAEKEIFAQWLGYEGTLLTAEGDNFVVTTDLENPELPAPEYQQYSAIGYDAVSQQHVVFWSDARGTDEYDVFFQLLGHGSTEADDNRPLRELAGVQEKPRASYNASSGETWVVWQHYLTGAPEQDVPYAVQLARLSSDGAVAGDVVTVTSGTVARWRAEYLLPDVACSGATGNCLVTWHHGGPEYRIFDSSGAPVNGTQLLQASSGFVTYGRAIAITPGEGEPRFVVTFSDADSIYYAEIPDAPLPTATPTQTPTPSETPTPTATPTSTPDGEPDLTRSYKEASPAVVGPYEEIAYTIVLKNHGQVAAQVSLTDKPPLPYKAGSANGGLVWDDLAGKLTWHGTVLAHESRVFSYRVHGYAPGIPYDTIYDNQAFIDDGWHPPFVRSASVLANPQPTATATPTATETPTATPTATATAASTATSTATATATATATPTPNLVYLPMVVRMDKSETRLTVPR